MQKKQFIESFIYLAEDYNKICGLMEEAGDNIYEYNEIDDGGEIKSEFRDILSGIKEKLTSEFMDDVRKLYDSAVEESE